MNTRVARGAVIAVTIAVALPLCAAQAQPRGGFGGPGFGGPGFGRGPGFGGPGFGRGPGFGGPGFGPGPGFGGPGYGGPGWHGGWGWPFLGGALLGLGLGVLPYYAALPPPYYPPAYYPYYATPGYYPYPYGYYPPYPYGYYPSAYAPGYSGYASASPPAAYTATQGYVQPGYAARDPNNCGTPDEPKPCPRR